MYWREQPTWEDKSLLEGYHKNWSEGNVEGGCRKFKFVSCLFWFSKHLYFGYFVNPCYTDREEFFNTFSSLFQSQLFVLFEHAAGFALFKVNEFEETGMLLPQVEASVTDLSRFNAVIKLIGFSPFKTATSALENMNSISEGKLLMFLCYILNE